MDKTQNHELKTLQHALDTIKSQKEQIDELSYTLVGVMLSVDKWLEGDELKQDEVNRAFTMREKILQIIENQQADEKELWEERNRIYKSLKETNAELEKYRKAYTTAQAEIDDFKAEIERLNNVHNKFKAKFSELAKEMGSLQIYFELRKLMQELTKRKEDIQG